MKGSKTLGYLLIFAGIIITYAGYKNVPILSVLGIGSAAQNSGGPQAVTPPDTLTGMKSHTYREQVPQVGNQMYEYPVPPGGTIGPGN